MSSTKRNFLLVDCNNFFASCERVFQPRLKQLPVVVLSSNDGCVIARSNEAKALGIPMGAPAFKYTKELAQCEIFSSNFALYSDMSLRVIEVLKTFTDQIEVYSIDEAFLVFDATQDLQQLAHKIRNKVKRWTGIPVSIGIAPTKTLAKVANKLAKKKEGVYSLDGEEIDPLLHNFPIDDVWNVGRSMGTFLKSRGIDNALRLKQMDALLLQKHFGIHGLKTLLELQGISCIDLQEVKPTRKSLVCSRSFGRPITDCFDLLAAINTFTAKGAKKLRHESLTASHITLFTCQSEASLAIAPTNHTRDLFSYTRALLPNLFSKGALYKKAGILFCDLQSQIHERDLFTSPQTLQRSKALSQLLDRINVRRKDKLFFASQQAKVDWQPLRQKESRAYTTNFNQLIEAV